MDYHPRIVFVVGCTASGKGTLGRALAEHAGAEILSVDSMKVYRLMDIGTAKPDPEVRRRIPHHLLDVVDPSESFSAGRFVEQAQRAIAEIHGRGRTIFAVGGTVLYLKALTEGLFEGPSADPAVRDALLRQATESGEEWLHQELARVDPETAQRLHHHDLKRVVRALEVYRLTGKPISSFQTQFGQLRTDYDMLFVGLRHGREELNRRINERVRRMVARGLVDEVRMLRDRVPPLSPQARDAVGYAEILDHFQGRSSLSDALERIKMNTRRLAKHQRTWFRRMPHIRWFDVGPETEPERTLGEVKTHVDAWLGTP
jgi:tRNA dimethylallyltransferase